VLRTELEDNDLITFCSQALPGIMAEHLASIFGTEKDRVNQGSQIHRISTKFDEMQCNRPGPNSKIGKFWNLNLNFLKIYKKYVKTR
jgi:hypothetical protein